jgi:hypothetical protein
MHRQTLSLNNAKAIEKITAIYGNVISPKEASQSMPIASPKKPKRKMSRSYQHMKEALLTSIKETDAELWLKLEQHRAFVLSTRKNLVIAKRLISIGRAVTSTTFPWSAPPEVRATVIQSGSIEPYAEWFKSTGREEFLPYLRGKAIWCSCGEHYTACHAKWLAEQVNALAPHSSAGTSEDTEP